MASIPPLAPADISVVLPAAVRAQMARAEELLQQSQAPQDPPAGENENAPQDPPLTHEVRAEHAPPQTPPPAQDDQSWEHRYNSMKGRFEASERKLSSLQNQIAELTDANNSLRNMVTALETRAPASPPAQAPLKPESLITDEERAEFGDEFLDVVARRAAEAVAPKFSELKHENEQLRNQLGKVGEKFIVDAREKLYSDLDATVPQWRETNHSQEFLDWLDLVDPYAGVIRKTLMRQAFERNDTPRVKAFFNGFHAEVAATAPASPGNSPSDDGKVSLESLAAPGRAKTGAAPASPSEKPTFTRAYVAQFYRDGRMGKWAGREVERNALEAQIIEAGREGRIR